MIAWRKYCYSLAALAGLSTLGLAQPPVAPPAPAPQPTLWGWLGFSKTDKAAKTDKFCKSPAGPMLNGMTKPLSLMTGGIIPSCCDGMPSPADLAKPEGSAEGAAARIKASEAEAKARRAAVRYLGTVDCRWHQEAQAALIDALLKDPNECVRYEAALALSRGCCCTPKVMEALVIVVEGKPKDGFPPETSERVRAAAMDALNTCAALHPDKPKEEPKEEEASGFEAAKYSASRKSGRHDVDDDSRRIPTGRRSLLGIFEHATAGSRAAPVQDVGHEQVPVRMPEVTAQPMPITEPAPVPTPAPKHVVDDFPGVIDLDVPETPKTPEPPVMPIVPVEPGEAAPPVHRIEVEDSEVVPSGFQPELPRLPAPSLGPVPEVNPEPVSGLPAASVTTDKKIPTGKRSLRAVLANAFKRSK